MNFAKMVATNSAKLGINMSDPTSKTTSQETALSVLDGSEEIRIAKNGNNYKVTSAQVADLATSPNLAISGVIQGTENDGALTAVLTAAAGHRFSVPFTPSIENPVSGMNWKAIKQSRVIQPFAKNLPISEDHFAQDNGYWTQLGGGSYSIGYQGMSIVAHDIHTTLRSADLCQVPAVTAAIQIRQTGSDDYDAVSVGFAIDANNYVAAFWEIGTNYVYVGVCNSGSFDRGTQIAIPVPSTVYGLCCEMEGDNFTAWIDIDGTETWFPVLQRNVTTWNFLEFSVLNTFAPCFGCNGGASTPWIVKSFKTGFAGSDFMRDYKQVIVKDGTPYTQNGWHYFTATNGTCAVWRINFQTLQMEKTAILLSTDNGTNLYLDLNFTFVFDPDINAWHLLTVNWGDNPDSAALRVRYSQYHGDPLNGVHVIPRGTVLNLTGPGGAYDASLVWEEANNRWVIGYANPVVSGYANFHPRVDYSPDLTTWTNIWFDSVDTGTEGVCLCKIGGVYYITAGNQSGTFPVWNMDTGASLGYMNVDIAPNPAGINPPHFSVYEVMENDTTQYYALSWQNTTWKTGVGTSSPADYGHNSVGTTIVYKAVQTETGYEFDTVGCA